MEVLKDKDIREQIISEYLRRASKSEFRVIEELDLCQGDARIDVAVIRKSITGIEIKSDRDNLSRLPKQIEVYNKVFSTVKIYAGSKHICNVLQQTPEWWGVVEVNSDEKGIHLVIHRKCRQNPSIDKLSLTQLLWKAEVLSILSTVMDCKGLQHKNKHHLWELLSEKLNKKELIRSVTECIKSRTYDSFGAPRKLYDGLCQLSPK